MKSDSNQKHVAEPARQTRVKDLGPRREQDVKAGDDMSLSLNFEKYKTTFTEYGR